MKAIIQLIRPHQWLKNLCVFLPLFFSGRMMEWHEVLLTFTVFVAYSFAASSIYCFNDVVDINADKLHETKSKRPLASGVISKSMAFGMMGFLLLLSFVVMCVFGETTKWNVLKIIGVYYLLNIAYCIKLKQIAIIDVFIIATGFVLRIYAGGMAIGIYVSHWIVLMTFLLALFLSFAKRRDDVLIYDKYTVKMRKNIDRYTLEFINQTISVIAAVTMVCYILYTVSVEVTAYFNTNYLYLTSVFVLAGIIRYLQLTIVDLKSGNPTKLLIQDRFIQLCVAGWIIMFTIIIYR